MVENIIIPKFEKGYAIRNINGLLSFKMQPGGNKFTPEEILEMNRNDPASRGKVIIQPLDDVSEDSILYNRSIKNTKDTRDWINSNPSHFYSLTSTDTADNFLPMGGGPGYIDIVNTGTHVVSTKQELIDAFDVVQSGEIIFVAGDAVIDMTGSQITCDVENIQLRSNRGYGNSLGGLIKSDTKYPDVSPFIDDHIIMLNGANSRVSGIRMWGSEAEVKLYGTDPVSCILRLGTEFIEVDNCEFSKGNKWALECYKAGNQSIHHNLFTMTTMDGIGYGIHVRIPEPDRELPENEIDDVYGNLFMYHRHDMASAGTINSAYVFRNNMVIVHDRANHKVDRHGGNVNTKTDVHNNILRGNGYDFAGWSLPMINGGYLKFTDNWTEKDTLDGLTDGSIAPDDVDQVDDTTGNTFAGSGWVDDYVPTVTITSDKTSGEFPLEVTFTATGVDPSGVAPIYNYMWEFDNSRVREITPSNIYVKTFDSPGLYSVKVRPINRFGVTGEPRSVIIDVKTDNNQDTILDGMVDWWTFTGSTTEEKNTGKLHGKTFYEAGDTVPSNTLVYHGDGIQGDAVTFDGTSSLNMTPGENAEASQTEDHDWTVGIWIKRNQIVSGANIGLLSTGSKNRIYIDNWQMGSDNASRSFGLIDDEWVCCIFELDRFVNRAVWTNNVEGASNNIPSELLDMCDYGHSNVFQLAPKSSLKRFSGDLSCCVLWRRKLTADEKTWFYNSGAGRDFYDI